MIAGVDYDSFGVWIAMLPHETNDGILVPLSYRHRSRESASEYAFTATRRIPHLIAGHVHPRPDVVFVERGHAPPKMQKSLFGMGRVQGAVVASLALVMPDVPVNELRDAEWKHALTGNGRATKTAAHAALAERLGLDVAELPSNENLRDALAIAWTGRELNRKASGG